MIFPGKACSAVSQHQENLKIRKHRQEQKGNDVVTKTQKIF